MKAILNFRSVPQKAKLAFERGKKLMKDYLKKILIRPGTYVADDNDGNVFISLSVEGLSFTTTYNKKRHVLDIAISEDHKFDAEKANEFLKQFPQVEEIFTSKQLLEITFKTKLQDELKHEILTTLFEHFYQLHQTEEENIILSELSEKI